MPIFITRRFQMSRDFRTVVWGATLQYNLLRSFCAGVVWSVAIVLLSGSLSNSIVELAVPVLWPIAYLTVFLPMGLLLVALSQFHPAFALCQVVLSSLAVAIGDPLVLLIERLRPYLVPVPNPPIIYLKLIVFILR